MTGTADRVRRLRTAIATAVALACPLAGGQTQPAPPSSALDAPLFYQLVIGELELVAGRAGNAYEVILDAARRHGDDQLYQRATEIALQAHAGDQALAAARAWRTAKPRSIAAMRYETQILFALNRADEAAEPLAAWIAALPVIERPSLIVNLPRLLQRMADKRQALALVERLVAPYREAAETRASSRIAVARARLAAGDTEGAVRLTVEAAQLDPASSAAAAFALELPASPVTEALIAGYLGRADADSGVRLAWIRALIQQQRYAEALPELERLTRDQPMLADTWLTLGAMRLEMRQPQQAETALLKYLDLAPANEGANADAAHAVDSTDGAGDDGPGGGLGRTRAWLLLAQAAELRGDVAAAEGWLAKVDNPRQALEVQSRRASLLMRQGKAKEARALIQAVPERGADDARAKALAEAQLLRDAKLWRDASSVLERAQQRFPEDVDLLYEQAMIDEKLERYDEMERRLRLVILLKPDHPHAHNALGYSLADRNLRLPEARELIRQALALAPGDPFITDSLGWVEYRLGNRDEALRLLRQAYRARPDTEIAAHLGEVLWSAGQREEARQVWLEGRGRDSGNEVLKETLARLKVGL